jgi:hypothetical protein
MPDEPNNWLTRLGEKLNPYMNVINFGGIGVGTVIAIIAIFV